MDDTLGIDETLRDSGLGSARPQPSSRGSRAQPEQIGPYRVLMRLGSGGMGDVYLVEHAELNQRYALKLIRPDLALDPQVRGRFQRECETLSRVDTHPGIVRVHGAGLEPVPYLVMEFVQGRSLLRALRDGMPEASVLDVLVETADALGYAHARGLVHRDVKPGNILVDVEGRARLTDFGLAKVFTQVDHEHLTVTGEVVGTPAYMAPEQVNPDLGPVGPRTDVYALGAILYEALLGHPPHVADSAIAVFERLLNAAQIPKVRAQRRDVSPALEAVCLKALSHDPQDRQPHAGVFAAELREARSAEGARPRGASGGLKPPHAVALVAVTLGFGIALGIGWERTRLAEPAAPIPAAELSGLPLPASLSRVTPTPQPTPAGPALLGIDDVPRLRPAELKLGRVVTVRSPSEDRLYLAALLKDAGDAGYDVLYADGHTERAGVPKGGFLPDLFLPGAQVERILIAGGDFADGVIVERRGQAVLVESEGERRWIPIWQVRVRKTQRVPLPTEQVPLGKLVMARYSGGELYYAAVELERKAGKVRALYLLDGDQEWRGVSQVRRLPREGEPVFLSLYDGSGSVPGVLVRRLGAIAVEIRLADERVVWAALCQLRTKR